LKENHIQSFGALSEDFHKWPMLARLTGAQFDTRYNHLWMLPQLVLEAKSNHPRSDHQWIIENVGRGLAEDLTLRKPEVVFVSNDKQFFGYDFAVDIPQFFKRVPEFEKAWSHYRYASVIDDCAPKKPGDTVIAAGCRYDIYRRIAP
jgi:hypothetical protein